MAGSLLPLSFGHKVRSFSLETFGSYAKFAVITLLPFAVVADRRSIKTVLAISLYILYIIAFYSFFMHWHFERYVFPFIFSAFVYFIILIISEKPPRQRTNLILLGIYAFFMFIPGAFQGYSWVSGYRVSMLNQKGIADAFVNAQIDPQHQIYASYDAGYIAYKTGWKIVDLQGLTTPEVMHQDIGHVLAEKNPTVLIVATSAYTVPSAIMLHSQYQPDPEPVPANYRFVKHLPLTNRYWWGGLEYSYYIFVNENANAALTAGLESISIDARQAMGYQRYLYGVLERLSRLRF